MMKTDSVQDSPIFTNGALKIDYAAGCAYIDGAELHLDAHRIQAAVPALKKCG